MRTASAILLLLFSASPSFAGEPVHHDLRLTLSPERHAVSAVDTVTFPEGFRAGEGEIRFTLHEGMAPRLLTPGARIERTDGPSGDPPVETYLLSLPPGARTAVLEYGGRIDHPLRQVGEEYARGQKDTPGAIGPEGVYLTGGSGWYPRFPGEPLLTFRVEVLLPAGWGAVSQGEREIRETDDAGVRVAWNSRIPQEEICLVAGRYAEYLREAGTAKAMVFLREPDDALAGRYLDATARYLALYEGLIGPYPFPKFAMVENFWETGYGMPEFTLLGPAVLRLPFILHTSYPHEILHSWWGNGVYIDYGSGNWGEGLTAYLSDHLMKERQGAGAEYRQTTLQKYADYVLAGRDLPLTEFRSRHGSVTEAVGYGKTLMLFHMLRQSLGDETFRKGLRNLYRDHRFRAAGFTEVRESFEEAAGRDLADRFDPWVIRAGAPRIAVRSARATPEGGRFRLRAVLAQLQEGESFPVRVPLAVTLEGRESAHEAAVEMAGKEARIDLLLPARPLRLDVDPRFDLFRRLSRNEIPPALTQAFGAERVLILLPSGAGEGWRDGWRRLAEALGRTGPGKVEIGYDAELSELPGDRSVWLFGWENRFLPGVREGLAPYDSRIGEDSVLLEERELDRKGHAFTLAVRHPGNPELAMLWIGADDPEALAGLGRKLPHYHKYSYLAFEGKEPANVAKGRWPVTGSPMTVHLPREDGAPSRVRMAKLSPERPLAELPGPFSRERMMEDVRFLASPEMKGRGFGTKELNRAAEHIAKRFAEAGLLPGGTAEGSWFQDFPERGGDPEADTVLRNVIGVIPGTIPERAGESVVIGAHYDHLGTGWPSGLPEHRGKVHPGADDNASGVAVLLELARVLGRSLAPDRTVVFVAFSGEECGRRGSRYYVANEKRRPAAKAIGMINLDTVGRLGKKLLVLSAGSAAEWPHIFRGAGAVSGVEVDVVTKEDLEASDQASFLEAGVPAVQLFTGPHEDYHRPTDTPDGIHADGLVKVVSVGREALEYLAARTEPLTSALGAAEGGSAGRRGSAAPRKVRLGVIPDFAHAGEGVRLSGVMPGSPAEKAGMREGDILVRIDDAPVTALRDLSRILSTYEAGRRARLIYLRDGAERTAWAVLDAR